MCVSVISNKKQQEIATGTPPWHAQFFVGTALAISVKNFPSLESLNHVATLDTFTNRVFPEYMSLKTLGLIRLCIAISIWIVTLCMVLGDGWTMYTIYKRNSKLNNSYVKLKGIRTLFPFTSWSWILLGLSFSFHAMIAIQVERGAAGKIEPWMMGTALILFEIAAPFSLLVSSVVRYAIWPAVLKGGKPHSLNGFRNQMMHNMNAVFGLTEMCLLGGIPMSFSHISVPCFVGCSYALFAWSTAHFLGKAGTMPGPQYQYFFLDTTLGKSTTISLVVLLMILMSSFAVFAGIETVVEWFGGSFVINALCVLSISSMVCRIRE
jgi:hypothetical protein